MKTIFRFFVDRPRIVNLILILVLAMGITSFFGLNRNTFPSVDFNVLFINTVYPGAAAKDVEINVTIPIEEELLNVDGIKDLNSYSTENFSSVIVVIDPNVGDKQKVKDDVQKAVDRVTKLPREVTGRPTVIELGSDIFPIFEVAISGDVPELTLRQYAKTLEKKLKQIGGVGATNKLGYRKREVKIEYDIRKGEQNYVSLGEVMAAISATNVRISGGTLQSTAAKKNIVTLAQFDDPLEVRDVIVRSAFSGRRLIVADVARVLNDFEKRDVIVRTNDQPSINIVVSKKAGADAVSTAEKVRQVVEESKRYLPKGVEARVVRDLSVFVNITLNSVTINAIIGFFLVVICLMIFLDFWSAVWTAVGIPVALFTTFYFMSAAGIGITNISLLAMIIVLGMLVDNGIVISEYIFTLREKGMAPKDASVEGVSEIFWPVLTTVTTTIAAFLPILLMGGIFGDWLRAIPLVVSFLLIASLVASVILLPSQLALSRGKVKEKPKSILWLEGIYRRNLLRVLRKKYLVVGFFVLLFIFSVGVILPLLGFELFPMSDNDIVQIRIETPKGTPLEETSRRVEKIEAIVTGTIPENVLSSYVTTIGEKVQEEDDIYGVRQSHWARMVINLIPKQNRSLSAFMIKDQLDRKFQSLKGDDFEVLETSLMGGGPPIGKPVDVSFIGDNDEVRTRLADELYKFLKANPAVYDISRDDEYGPREISVELDKGLMSELGITALDVALTVRAAYDGNVVTSIRKYGEEIDFRVMVDDRYQTDPRYIRELTIMNRMGKLIRLGNFIRFKEKESPLAIRHQGGERSTRLRSELDQKKIKSIEMARLIREKFEPMVAQYPDMRIRFGGIEESTNESLTNFFNAFLIAVIAIYILLVLLFNSLTEPLIVMLAIPFGLIGVIFAFLIHLTPVTFLGLIGILGLAGVVVNNSLVMLSFLNEEESKVCERGHELKLEHVVNISVTRLRPILLTTVTTVAGLLPSVYGLFGGKIDSLFPLLLAICYGLIFSTLITLFLIPAIYLIERDFGCWFYARFAKSGQPPQVSG